MSKKKTITTLALSALCQWCPLCRKQFQPKKQNELWQHINRVHISQSRFPPISFFILNTIVGFVLSHFVIGHLIGALLNRVVRGPMDRLVAVTHWS